MATREITKREELRPTTVSSLGLAAWTTAVLLFGALLLTDVVVGTGSGGLVIDWKIGPAFLALVGSVWGARRAHRKWSAQENEDALIAEEEELKLLEMSGRGRAISSPTGDPPRLEAQRRTNQMSVPPGAAENHRD